MQETHKRTHSPKMEKVISLLSFSEQAIVSQKIFIKYLEYLDKRIQGTLLMVLPWESCFDDWYLGN